MQRTIWSFVYFPNPMFSSVSLKSYLPTFAGPFFSPCVFFVIQCTTVPQATHMRAGANPTVTTVAQKAPLWPTVVATNVIRM